MAKIEKETQIEITPENVIGEGGQVNLNETPTIQGVTPEIQALMAEVAALKAKAAEREAAEAAKAATEDAAKEEMKKQMAYMEELVTIKLYRGPEEKYKQPLTVGVNGEVIMIQRGKEVQVKRKFAEVIKNHEEQIAYSVSLMEALQDDYKKNEDRLE